MRKVFVEDHEIRVDRVNGKTAICKEDILQALSQEVDTSKCTMLKEERDRHSLIINSGLTISEAWAFEAELNEKARKALEQTLQEGIQAQKEEMQKEWERAERVCVRQNAWQEDIQKAEEEYIKGWDDRHFNFEYEMQHYGDNTKKFNDPIKEDRKKEIISETEAWMRCDGGVPAMEGGSLVGDGTVERFVNGKYRVYSLPFGYEFARYNGVMVDDLVCDLAGNVYVEKKNRSCTNAIIYRPMGTEYITGILYALKYFSKEVREKYFPDGNKKDLRVKIPVWKLMLETWTKDVYFEPDEGYVTYVDEDSSNCELSNLKWNTYEEEIRNLKIPEENWAWYKVLEKAVKKWVEITLQPPANKDDKRKRANRRDLIGTNAQDRMEELALFEALATLDATKSQNEIESYCRNITSNVVMNWVRKHNPDVQVALDWNWENHLNRLYAGTFIPKKRSKKTQTDYKREHYVDEERKIRKRDGSIEVETISY